MSGHGNENEIGTSLKGLGIPAGEVRRVETISVRPGHRLYRILTHRCSFVLKSFSCNRPGNEIEAYSLLGQLGVPTIRVIAKTATDLLLEDLTCSDKWRLATESDVRERSVGEAVARWYWHFHQKGSSLAASGPTLPPFLKREEDLLDPASIESAGRALDLLRMDSWRLAADHIELLKLGLAGFGTTLNYNDFHWTNLALSRKSGPGMEAIVFDYDLLGIGTRYSDFRNVVGSLSGDAVTGFREVYGSVDPGEKTLDRPLATLYALVSATRMPTFPKWAEESRQAVLNGNFRTDLLQAVDLVIGGRKRGLTSGLVGARQATGSTSQPNPGPSDGLV